MLIKYSYGQSWFLNYFWSKLQGEILLSYLVGGLEEAKQAGDTWRKVKEFSTSSIIKNKAVALKLNPSVA